MIATLIKISWQTLNQRRISSPGTRKMKGDQSTLRFRYWLVFVRILVALPVTAPNWLRLIWVKAGKAVIFVPVTAHVLI